MTRERGGLAISEDITHQQERLERPTHIEPRALAGLGLGLGVAALVKPGSMLSWLGLEPRRGNARLLRWIGARELVTGAALLAQSNRSRWVWLRVAGDVMDLTLMSLALRQERTANMRQAAIATAAIGGITLVDLTAALQAGHTSPDAAGADSEPEFGARAISSITVRTSPREAYAAWRRFEDHPRFMHNLQSVRAIDARRSHWVARAPGGGTVAWDAEIVRDEPGEMISWRSVPGADVRNAGSVHFRPAPSNQGTELLLEINYDPPAGTLGRLIARVMGKEPGQEAAGGLRRFKSILETGEVLLSDGTLNGRGLPFRPAQPPDELWKFALTRRRARLGPDQARAEQGGLA